MSMKCYICDHEMEEKVTSINTGWGDYKITVSGVSAYVCPECGEMVLESKDTLMLQKLSESLEGHNKYIYNYPEQYAQDIISSFDLTPPTDLNKICEKLLYLVFIEINYLQN